MARRKDYENSTRDFHFYEDKVTGTSVPPAVRGRREVVSNPAARHMVGTALGEFRKALRMPKVNSNAELIQRIDEYFAMAQEREMPATIEELALYLGFVPAYLWELRTGRKKGFQDTETGFTTAEIIQKAVEVLHGTDVVLASTNRMNAAMYIWRGKNWYGEKDVQEISIQSNDGNRPPMTPDEIAELAKKNLPDHSTIKSDGTVR